MLPAKMSQELCTAMLTPCHHVAIKSYKKIEIRVGSHGYERRDRRVKKEREGGLDTHGKKRRKQESLRGV